MADEINYAFFEGGFVPLQDAKLSIMNHSFMYGTAVFEGIRGYWNPQDQEI
jgi:branched-chain amino acid aminotransferase